MKKSKIPLPGKKSAVSKGPFIRKGGGAFFSGKAGRPEKEDMVREDAPASQEATRSPYNPEETAWSGRYQALSAEERSAVNAAVDQLFQERTGIRRRLDWAEIKDRGLARQWLRIRDEVMAERAKITERSRLVEKPREEKTSTEETPVAAPPPKEQRSALFYLVQEELNIIGKSSGDIQQTLNTLEDAINSGISNDEFQELYESSRQVVIPNLKKKMEDAAGKGDIPEMMDLATKAMLYGMEGNDEEEVQNIIRTTIVNEAKNISQKAAANKNVAGMLDAVEKAIKAGDPKAEQELRDAIVPVLNGIVDEKITQAVKGHDPGPLIDVIEMTQTGLLPDKDAEVAKNKAVSMLGHLGYDDLAKTFGAPPKEKGKGALTADAYLRDIYVPNPVRQPQQVLPLVMYGYKENRTPGGEIASLWMETASGKNYYLYKDRKVYLD